MEKNVVVKQIIDSLKSFSDQEQNEILEEIVSRIKIKRSDEVRVLELKRIALNESIGSLPRFSKPFPPENMSDPISGRKEEVYA